MIRFKINWYGYQVWILPGSGYMFALLGAHGQYIFCRSHLETGHGSDCRSTEAD